MPLEVGTKFVLCTDGLTNMCADEELQNFSPRIISTKQQCWCKPTAEWRRGQHYLHCFGGTPATQDAEDD
ncbi:MAG: hypothetical protein ACLT3Y_01020 [Ruminococcus callidus]